MKTFTIIIDVKLKDAILDPKGKAAQHALNNSGFTEIKSVRIGKQIVLTIEAESDSMAVAKAEEAAEKILANPVIEDYSIHIA